MTIFIVIFGFFSECVSMIAFCFVRLILAHWWLELGPWMSFSRASGGPGAKASSVLVGGAGFWHLSLREDPKMVLASTSVLVVQQTPRIAAANVCAQQ